MILFGGYKIPLHELIHESFQWSNFTQTWNFFGLHHGQNQMDAIIQSVCILLKKFQ